MKTTTKKKASELRAKKLKYNNLKYKLQRAKLWKRYLEDKRAGVIGRGKSIDYMEELLVVPPLKRVPRTKDEVAEAFTNSKLPDTVAAGAKLLALCAKYESLSKERAAIATQIRGLLV